jgi:threonyl-tRNA synthetase
VLTISEKQNEYAEEVTQILKKRGIRANFDLRNEKIGFKIRENTLQKVPYLLVIGDKEVESGQVSVRSRDGTDLGVMKIDAICDILAHEIARKGQ